MKPKYYFDKCWQQEFVFMVGWKSADAKKFMKKAIGYEDDKYFHHGTTVFHPDGQGGIFIWTAPMKRSADKYAILAHECIHAAHVALMRAGVVSDFNNDEAVTYLVTALMQEALTK
jgi:hypothetical protein